MCNLPKEAEVHNIIRESLEIIEKEYGLFGIDCVIAYAQQRRTSICAEFQEEREESMRFQGEG